MCGCNCSGGRGFLTKQEKLEMLKEYKDNLDKESEAVTEKIKDIQKEK